MSAYGLRNYAYQGFGVKLSDREAGQWRDGFFNLYPGIAPWHETEINEMEKKGCITTVFGRRIPIPNIYSDDKKVQREAERFGINVLIQGPSSDYTLMGGDKVIKRPDYNRDECKPVLFIHDSIVWEVKTEHLSKWAKAIIGDMTSIDTQSKFGFTPSVPFVAEAEEGYNLADMIEYNPEEEI
jgi:DNA polymerase-1